MAKRRVKSLLDAINSNVGKTPVEESFLLELRRSMEATALKDVRNPSKSYKPSSMQCIRNMYYQRTGHKFTPSANYIMSGVTSCGSFIHEYIQAHISKMKENGYDCEWVDVAEFIENGDFPNIEVVEHVGAETKLYDHLLNLSFRCDGLIKYRGKYYIIEIKSEKRDKWYKRTGVDPSHYPQGTAYSCTLNVPDVIFIYVNRDIFDLKTYMFHPTEDMRLEFVNKINDCESYVAELKVPPKPENAPIKACQYCSYVEECKRESI